MLVEREVAASASAAWELLTGLASWPLWGPSVTAVEPAGATVAVGLRGRVRTPLGLWLPYEVTEVVPGRRWSWRVAGIPATGHVVEPVGDDRCRIGFEVPWWAPAYAVVCRLALDRIDRLLVPSAMDDGHAEPPHDEVPRGT